MSSRSTGTSAMISSCMFSSAPPMQKKMLTTGMTSASLPCSFATSHPTPCLSAPVWSTTVKAPPTRKTKKMTDAASAIPLGTATSIWKNPDRSRLAQRGTRAGDDDLSAGGGVVSPVVAPRRKNVAEDRRDQDAAAQQRERVWKAECRHDGAEHTASRHAS